MNCSFSPCRSRSPWLLVAIVLGVLGLVLAVTALALSVGGSSSTTGPRDCPARHTAAGSYVPAGARPCVLRTGGHPATAGAGTNDSSSRVDDRKQPGRQAPAAKAPAAPAARPPVIVRK
ncbi:hypothetical protein [Streptomyces griseus]|uniref:hypothetical protein n=1 Tax=Streptomyces griseus TaxID=1911 RepID=UPI0037953884